MHFRLDLRKGVCESQIQLNNSLSINKNQTSSVRSNNKVCFKYFNFGSKLGDNPFIPDNVPFAGCLKNIHINNNLKLVKDALRADHLEECDLDRICDLSPCGRHGECKMNKNSNQINDQPNIYSTYAGGHNNLTSRIKRTMDKTLNLFQNGLGFFNHHGFNGHLNIENYRKFDDQNGFSSPDRIVDGSNLNGFNQNANFVNSVSYNSNADNQTLNDWKCSCFAGYSGDFCELASCDRNPCSNQAVCVLFSNSELNCICPQHKFGDYCDLGK